MPTAKTLLSATLATTSVPAAPRAKSPKASKGATGAAAWLDVSALPPVRDAAGNATPVADVGALLHALEAGPKAEAEAALATLARSNEADVDALALELARAWVRARGPADATWALSAAARLGGRGTTRALALLVRRFGRDKAVPAALALLDALGETPSDAVLIELKKLEHAPKEVAAAAEKHLERIRKARDLDDEDIEDLAVPECSLRAGEELDFGSRTFCVDFDADFTPIVRDAEGARLANLPRAGKKDDAAKAAAALERWGDLKTLLRDTLRNESKRLEWSMCAEREWTTERFRAAVVGHPLLLRLAQRLLWAIKTDASEASGAPGDATLRCFRVAEDGTFADEADNPIELPPDAIVVLPHALHLSSAVCATWGSVFADYAIIPPFPQLGRETFTPTDAERSSTFLARFRGVAFSDKARYVLDNYGWLEDEDSRDSVLFRITLPDGTEAVADLDSKWERDITRRVEVHTNRKLGEMAPLSFSELCRDISRLPQLG